MRDSVKSVRRLTERMRPFVPLPRTRPAQVQGLGRGRPRGVSGPVNLRADLARLDFWQFPSSVPMALRGPRAGNSDFILDIGVDDKHICIGEAFNPGGAL